MSRYHLLATWEGFCASCDAERPLMLVEHGPRGLRAWLSGAGPEDRELSYACGLCGRVEQVPLTEAEDAEYDRTLLRWPDWVPTEVTGPVQMAEPVVPNVFATAAARLALMALAEPVVAEQLVQLPVAHVVRRPQVHVLTLPVQRVSATDERLLALAAA